MKAAIHPEYFKARVTCACGAVLDTHSTRGSFSTDVCSTCHPFYTGKQKLMDTAGRVDKFRRKYATQAAEKQSAEKAAADKAAAAAAPVEELPAE